MDPLSIICAAGSATQGACWVSTSLYTFITSSKGVEKTLSDLQAEVEGLQCLLQAVESSLKGPAAARKGSAAGEEEIWTSLNIAIKDAQRTISALRDIVEALTTTKSPSFFRKAIKQVKLNIEADEISDIRVRVRTHTGSIQLALSMATMLISSQSSDQVINEIGPKLDKIFQDLRSSHRTTNDKLPSSFRNPNILAHTERLISSASTVIGQGSTVWGGSEMGLPHSSEAGGSFDKAKKSHIEDWIPQLTIPEEEGSQTSEPRALTAASSTVVEERGLDVEENEYSDSDGDDDYDFAQKCFEQAETYFSNHEHARAVKSFRAGLKRADGLGFEKRNRLELRNIKRELALSLLHQGELDEAADLFQTLVTASTTDRRSVGLALHGSSGMAQVCLCRRSYVEAEDWCKKSRKGWKRAVGRRHTHYIDSLRLTAFLYELKGDSADASAYEDLVRDAEKLVDGSSKVPMLLGFSADQTRNLITTYHWTHSALPEDLCDPRERQETVPDSHTPNIIRIEEVETPKEIHQIHLKPQTSNDAAKPSPEVSVHDLGTSPQPENVLLGRESNKHSTRPSTVSDSGLSSFSRAHLSSSRTSRSQSIISDEARSFVSDSQQGDGKSFSRRLQEKRTRSALHSAARKGDLAALAKLLSKGAPVESKNSSGKTLLCLAVIGGHIPAMELLLKHKAMIEARTNKGCTPLLCAGENVSQSRNGAMRTLLEAGANINAQDENGDTALFHAVALSRPDWVKLLLEFKPNLEVRNYATQTALLRAVDFSAIAYPKPLIETVQLLLDAGANAKVLDAKGQTAVLIAVQAMALRTVFYERYAPDYVELLKILCASGVDARSLSVNRVSALSCTGQIKDAVLRDGVRKVLMRYGAT